PLPAPCKDERLLLRLFKCRVVLYVLAEMFLPEHDFWGDLLRVFRDDLRPGQGTDLAAQMIRKEESKLLRQCGEVDCLDSAAMRQQWRIAVRKVRADLLDPINRPEGFRNFVKLDVNPPTDRIPVSS